jgi:hypothetical protein
LEKRFVYLRRIDTRVFKIHLNIPIPYRRMGIMTSRHKAFLLIDGMANLMLGILLLLFPFGVAETLGIPQASSNFYPTIPGGVILGIGIALLLEVYGQRRRIRGLGLGGAIVINICGASVLALWLILEPLNIPLRGLIILWGVAVVVLGIGILEILTKTWRYD